MSNKNTQILFICDRQKCGERCNPDCRLTSDPRHAAHFHIKESLGEPIFIENSGIERSMKS